MKTGLAGLSRLNIHISSLSAITLGVQSLVTSSTGCLFSTTLTPLDAGVMTSFPIGVFSEIVVIAG